MPGILKVSLLVLFFQHLGIHAQDVFEAARKGNMPRMEALFAMRPDTIHTRNENGFTPLIIAGYRNQIKVVEFLLQHGADINANSQEGPVILGACYHGNLELTQLLVAHKANLNVQNETGTTPLIFAVIANNVELVKFLLKNGANKELKEKSGRTALDYARLYQLKEIELLLYE